MACSKHPVRKRKDCPECQAELNVKIVKSLPTVEDTKKAHEELKEVVTQKTSREMLVEMEKETDELVVKKSRAKKEKPVNNKAVSKPEVKAEEKADITPAIDQIAANKAVIDKYFTDKLAEFKVKIYSEAYIRWEHLDIPANKCNMETISILEKDGWKYVDLYIQENIFKVSGFTSPVAVFQRVKGPDYKKTLEVYKKEIK